MATQPPARGEPGFADWPAGRARGLAELAFGTLTRSVDLTPARHLALLPAGSLELDLHDPAQRQFGDYELLELLGEGGMGVVYRARQVSLDREVALKLLAAGPWASHEFIARFEREAQNAARMQHPAIVTIYEVGNFDGIQFFSMRLVRGESLSACLRRGGKFTPREAAALMRTVAEAVGYAHSLGVLHLDLKPANVLLDETCQPYVADFGLARRLESALAVDNDEVSGTPAYMAPEQAEVRANKLTAATDIWGLGAILYQMLTGQPPFRGDTPQDTVKLVLQGQVRSPRRFRPALALDLQAVVMRCLARDPQARYPTARALADDLQRYLEGRPVQARPLNMARKVWRWGRREPWLAGLAASFAIALVAGLVGVAWQWREATANAARADRVRAFLVGVLRQANPDQNQGRPVTATQLLDYATRELDTPFAQAPAVQTDLASTVGTLYLELGKDAQAEAVLARARRAYRLPGVPDDVRARALDAFARAETQQHQLGAASAHAREALDLAQRSGNAQDISRARRLAAETLFDTGHPAPAEQLLRKALAADRARTGNAGDDTIDDLLQLGAELHEQSRFDESLVLTREAAAAATRRYGRNNSKLISALDYQARALKALGRTTEALPKAREAAALATQLYGPENQITIALQSNVGSDLRAAGRFADALQLDLGLLPAIRQLASRRAVQSAFTCQMIAADYLGLGKFTQAEAAARHSIATWREVHHGADDWDSAVPLGLLGEALQWQGRYAEAEDAFRRDLALELANEAPDSAWLNQVRALLGNLLRLRHRYAEADGLLQAAFSAMPDKPTLVRAAIEAQWATALMETGKLAMAQPHAAAALAAMRRLAPAGSLQLGLPLLAEARVSLAAGDAARADALAREAFEVRGRWYAAGDPRVLETEVVRVEALRALGRDAEAVALAARVRVALAAVAKPVASDFEQRMVARH